MSFDFFLPVLTYPDPTPVAGLTRALDMAASIGGRLSPLIAEIDIPPLPSLLGDMLIDVSGMSVEAEARSRKAGDEIAATLTHLAGRLGLPTSLKRQRCFAVDLPDQFAVAARLHDCSLMVLDPSGRQHLDLVEAILFGSGGPVLLCPAHEGPGHLLAASVAWDGSRASARALRDALPVLKLAKKVTILTLDDDKPIEQAGIEGLVAFLAYHGIRATRENRQRRDAPAGEALQALAIELDAGLLVMGAYGHSRLREFVLGGATATALQAPQLPIFMSH